MSPLRNTKKGKRNLIHYLKNESDIHRKGGGDCLNWQQEDKKMLRKVNELIKAIKREPFSGIGKPEPLKFDLAGY